MDKKFLHLFKKEIDNYSGNSPFSKSLLIAKQKDIEVYFSPFEYVNTNARIVLVGISPGPTQAHNANVAAQMGFKNGLSEDCISQMAKETASLSGALRINLIAMLDHIGINKRLSIRSCASLFNENKNLVHNTSIFRYPTLFKGKPISTAKNGLNNGMLKNMVTSYFENECLQLQGNPLFIPLGQGVAEILLSLSQQRKIQEKISFLGCLTHQELMLNESVIF
jgi:hypothetical protein